MSQRVVSTHMGSLQLSDEDQQCEEDEDTQSAFFGYVFERASRDSALSREQVTTFESVQQRSGGRSNQTQAALVGRRLAELGDEIDAQYNAELDEIVQLSGNPETAFSMFADIVKNLFDWDESGGARINVGRIAALMAYCYRLCKTYIEKHLSVGGLMGFLMMVGGWLFRFLLKAKFYEWLERQGGWGQLLALTTSGWGQHVFLVIGVSSLLVWAYSYFRGR